MAGEIEKINEIFRIHDEKKKISDEEKPEKENTAPQAAPAEEKKEAYKTGKQKISAVDKLFIDEQGDEVPNYTGDEESERDFRPVRQSRESKTGCLGGVMYFVFVVCVSVILACVAWMAASDMLALNQGDFTATVTLPSSIFETETVDTFDEDGNKTGTERVSRADINYVASELKQAGLIEYEWLFKFFCQISHADTKVTPGSYELKSTYDYRALVQNMQPGSGSAVTITVTIPEGYSLNQIFRKLEENDVCSYDELVEAAANSNYKYSFLEGIEAGDMTRLEGFLFPDTYEFYVGMQASSAINKFLERFNYVFTADMLKQASDRGLTIKQVITVASLIEKEAAVDAEKGIDERGLVASVIYNRLNAGMPLGIDASILYLYPDHEGGPTAEMLAQDSPYNTRLYTGLPPTPIGNPGLAAIQAALNPETTSYYYYALDTETNTHRFFTNDYEFNNFVATQNYG